MMKMFRWIGIDIDPFIVFREGLDLCPATAGDLPMDELMVAMIESDQLPRIEELPDRQTTVDVMKARLRRGDRCLGVFHREKLIAFSWAFLSHIYLGRYRLPLEPDEAYLFDAYTVPDFRGRGLSGFLRYHLYRELQKQGRTWLYSISYADNHPALRFKEKLGGYPIHRGVSIRLFHRWRLGTRADAGVLRSAKPALKTSLPTR